MWTLSTKLYKCKCKNYRHSMATHPNMNTVTIWDTNFNVNIINITLNAHLKVNIIKIISDTNINMTIINITSDNKVKLEHNKHTMNIIHIIKREYYHNIRQTHFNVNIIKRLSVTHLNINITKIIITTSQFSSQPLSMINSWPMLNFVSFLSLWVSNRVCIRS